MKPLAAIGDGAFDVEGHVFCSDDNKCSIESVDETLEIPDLKIEVRDTDKILSLGVKDLKALARASELTGADVLELRLDADGWHSTQFGEQRTRPIRVAAMADDGATLARAIITPKVRA